MNQRDQHRVSVLRAITEELFSTLDFEERLQRILRLAMQSVQAEGGSILLHEPSSHSLVFRYVVGPKAKELIGRTMPADKGMAGKVFRTRIPLLTLAPDQDPDHYDGVDQTLGYRTTSLVTVPLRSSGEKPLGILQVVNRQGGEFDQADVSLLEIGGGVSALALRNAHLAKEAQLASLAQMLGGLSHDLKNKVMLVAGWIDTARPALASLGKNDPDAHALLSEALDAIEGAADEVYRLAKLFADAVKGLVSETRLEPVSLGDRLREALDEIAGEAKRQGVRLHTEIEPVPEAMLDRFLLGQMLYNLLHNAIGATPPGGEVSVRVSCRPEGGLLQGTHLHLEIADTGCGMPPDVARAILQGQALSRKAAGTGLGTRIIRNAVLAHKGRWDIASELGAGTRFHIEIPFVAGTA